MEHFEDRNVTAAVIRSTPNGINDLFSKIDQATSDSEVEQNASFGSSVLALNRDVDMLRASVHDALLTGDALYGTAGHTEVSKQVKDRNEDLKSQKEKLRETIEKEEKIIQKNNRDFTDVRDTLPEKQTFSSIKTLEDYTLYVLLISYLVFAIAYIYSNASTAMVPFTSILQSLGFLGIVTAMGSLLMYYFV